MDPMYKRLCHKIVYWPGFMISNAYCRRKKIKINDAYNGCASLFAYISKQEVCCQGNTATRFYSKFESFTIRMKCSDVSANVRRSLTPFFPSDHILEWVLQLKIHFKVLIVFYGGSMQRDLFAQNQDWVC
jgi:hypothetical protein